MSGKKKWLVSSLERLGSVRCFNKHERFPLSHLYFAHVSRDCSASYSSPSIDNRPNAVKKNSFTLHLLFTTTYTILCNTTKHPIFSPLPPSLFLPSQLCVFSSHHHSFPPELISLLYELHLSTTSTSGVPLPRLPPSFTIISRLKRDKKYYRWEKARR